MGHCTPERDTVDLVICYNQDVLDEVLRALRCS